MSIIVVMKKIYDFFVGHKYAFFWTVGYFCVVWVILYFLFKFDFFNVVQWNRLLRAQLQGFPGFVFGLLILAALPLYVATTTIIIRKKQPLITIPVPKIKIPNLGKKTQEKEPVAEKEEKQEEAKPENDLPADLPLEMKPVFMRAKQNLLFMQQAGTKLPEVSAPQDLESQEQVVDALPVPTDFDIDFDDDDEMADVDYGGMPMFSGADAPMFKDISFDDDDDDFVDTDLETGVDNSELVKCLTNKKRDFSVEEGVVLTKTHAIAIHSDKDFWVADAENWFAAGKMCESPIVAAQRAAEKYGLTPAIYLEANNILDIDKLIQQWQQDGILVITDLTEI